MDSARGIVGVDAPPGEDTTRVEALSGRRRRARLSMAYRTGRMRKIFEMTRDAGKSPSPGRTAGAWTALYGSLFYRRISDALPILPTQKTCNGGEKKI